MLSSIRTLIEVGQMICSRTKQWNIFTDDLQWLTFQSFLGRTTPNMPATFWLGFTKVINPESLINLLTGMFES